MSVHVNTNAIMTMQAVGDQLRRLREEADLRQDDAAAKLGVTRYTISKVERGKAFPTATQLKVLFRVYKVSPEERAAIRAVIDQGRSFGRAWWEQPRFRKHFSGDGYRYFPIEDAAERIYHHSGTYLPGLLQTPAYIEAIVAFGQAQESVERRKIFVEARLARQAVLTRRNATTLDALCLESALRAVVGGPPVMREQLRHLAEVVQRPNVTLRMIPYSAGAPSIAATPFTVLDFPGSGNPSVASQEMLTSEMIYEDPAEVRRSRRKFTDLAAHALTPEETVHFIKNLEKELR